MSDSSWTIVYPHEIQNRSVLLWYHHEKGQSQYWSATHRCLFAYASIELLLSMYISEIQSGRSTLLRSLEKIVHGLLAFIVA